MGNCDMISQ